MGYKKLFVCVLIIGAFLSLATSWSFIDKVATLAEEKGIEKLQSNHASAIVGGATRIFSWEKVSCILRRPKSNTRPSNISINAWQSVIPCMIQSKRLFMRKPKDRSNSWIFNFVESPSTKT